jgi:hypothetical protein
MSGYLDVKSKFKIRGYPDTECQRKKVQWLFLYINIWHALYVSAYNNGQNISQNKKQGKKLGRKRKTL